MTGAHRAVGLALLVFALGGCTRQSAKFDDFPTQPKCPALATEDVWQAHYDACLGPFKANLGQKGFSIAEAEASCRCSANGHINDLSCEELRDFKIDSPKGEEKMRYVSGVCRNHFASLRKAAH